MLNNWYVLSLYNLQRWMCGTCVIYIQLRETLELSDNAEADVLNLEFWCPVNVVSESKAQKTLLLTRLLDRCIKIQTIKSSRRPQPLRSTGPPACSVLYDIVIAICHFLLVVHWNWGSISNRFRDIRPQHMLTKVHTSERTNVPTDKRNGSQYAIYVLADVIIN